MSLSDKLLLWKRAIIEAVNDELKNIAQVEHYFTFASQTVTFGSWHRTFDKFIVNLLGAIAEYYCFPKKWCVNVVSFIVT